MNLENKKSFVFFTKMCDELVQHAIDNDPELLEGIRWLDSKAQKEGITFYEMTFRTLYKHDIKDRASAWLTDRKQTSKESQE